MWEGCSKDQELQTEMWSPLDLKPQCETVRRPDQKIGEARWCLMTYKVHEELVMSLITVWHDRAGRGRKRRGDAMKARILWCFLNDMKKRLDELWDSNFRCWSEIMLRFCADDQSWLTSLEKLWGLSTRTSAYQDWDGGNLKKSDQWRRSRWTQIHSWVYSSARRLL